MPGPLPEPLPLNRLVVPPPDASEERRAWAQVFSDLHHVVSIIELNPSYFIPGEHVDKFLAASQRLKDSLHTVVAALALQVKLGGSPPPPPPLPVPNLPDDALKNAQLDGATGELKRSILTQFYNRFLGYFRSQPTIRKNLRYAADAAARHADMGSVALDSLGAVVQKVPALALACKGAEEGS